MEDRTAIAPGVATVKRGGGLPLITVKVSAIDAAAYARDLASPPSAEVVVREGARILSSTLKTTPSFPRRGSLSLGGSDYRVVTESFIGFGNRRVDVTVLSNTSATSSSVGT